MGGDNKPDLPSNPIAWIFRMSLLLLGAIIVLNVAIAYLQPILPWLLGAAGLAAGIWITVAVVRWRRSRW